MEYTNSPGTGNSSSKINKTKMIEYNNIKIDRKRVNSILNKIEKEFGISNVNVELSNRDTKRRWGTAFLNQNKIIIYRHSLHVLLHELAHIITYNRYKSVYHIGIVKPHGKQYGTALRQVYAMYDNM